MGRGAADHARACAYLGLDREAYAALDRAGRHTSFDREPYTAFTFPACQWHAAASRVHTMFRNTATARDHQREALEGFPTYDVTSRALVEFDVAECLASDGKREDARRHVYKTMTDVPRQWRSSVITDRGREVADVLGGGI